MRSTLLAMVMVTVSAAASAASAADVVPPPVPNATPFVRLMPAYVDDGYYYGTHWPACQYRYHFWCRRDAYGGQFCACWPDPGLHTGW